MTFFRSSKHQRLWWSLLLLSVGAAAGFGLGIFCGAEPPVGCRESDLTPVPDESFVSPASASSVETSPEPVPMPEKWVCLTFDDGPSKTTPDVLSALNRAGVKATFFVVGHFLETSPDLVRKMVEEGHTVGNHTYHHPDMSEIADVSSFQKEVEDVKLLYEEITDKEMVKFYRPPQGKYSESNLKMAKELGYYTFFWSLAYVDWDPDNQPTKEEAFEKLTGRIHPGAIVLLHNTSKTNGEILDELLTKWEEMGYHFGTLDELIAGSNS